MNFVEILYANIVDTLEYILFTLVPNILSNPKGQLNTMISWLINSAVWVKFLVLSTLVVIGRTIVYSINDPILMLLKVFLMVIFSISIYQLSYLILP